NMPTGASECTQIIKWKYRDDKQATATCLEYFATTFVEGKKGSDDSEIVCTISRQFECKHIVCSVPMFDKCYTFPTTDVTMKNYLANRRTYCPDGATPDWRNSRVPHYD
ncbi:hypothetical protein PENTCL1PPCAC_3379, partial [Pristionchus entomophagus]